MADPRDELLHYYGALRRFGLNDSHSGNASVRDGDTVWITPSGAPAERLARANLVACALPDRLGDGASLDGRLHLAVYRECPAAGAVLHAHNPHVLALTMSGRAFTPADEEGRLYFGEVPVVTLDGADYWTAHKTQAPLRISRVLATRPACVLRGHGVYARGRSLDEAYKWLCSLEHSARIAWLAMQSSKY